MDAITANTGLNESWVWDALEGRMAVPTNDAVGIFWVNFHEPSAPAPALAAYQR